MNCDNCEIEVPCAEDCEQCKKREENQEPCPHNHLTCNDTGILPNIKQCTECGELVNTRENQEPAEPVETADKIINKWPEWKKNIRCRPSLVNQEPAEKPISCYSCQHRNGCTYPESKVGGPCILYLKCQSKEPAEKKDEFIKECYELLAKGATEEQWEFATKLRLVCDRIEATENRDKKAVELLEKAYMQGTVNLGIKCVILTSEKYHQAIALLQEKRK